MNGMVNPEDYVGDAMWDDCIVQEVEAVDGETELHLSIAGDRYRSRQWAFGLVGGILIAGALGFLLTTVLSGAVQMIVGW